MILYYTQISNRDTKKILCDAFSNHGFAIKDNKILFFELKDLINAPKTVFDKIYSANSKSGNCMLYSKHTTNLIVSCISDKQSNLKNVAKYFDLIIKSYHESYKDFLNVHYEFETTLEKLSNDFNRNLRMSNGIEELESAHNILVENLDSLINRGENINNLKDLADKVSFETKEMSKKVGEIRKNMRYEKYKSYIIVAIVVAIIILIFYNFNFN